MVSLDRLGRLGRMLNPWRSAQARRERRERAERLEVDRRVAEEIARREETRRAIDASVAWLRRTAGARARRRADT